eukprot:2658608-Amphidinium_carterae.1
MVALRGTWRVMAPESNANAQKPQSNKCAKERAIATTLPILFCRLRCTHLAACRCWARSMGRGSS